MKNIFSPLENEILKILGKKHLTIVAITKEVYNRPTMNSANVVASAIRRINLKCELHETSWFINGSGTGRAGRTVWKDAVKENK